MCYQRNLHSAKDGFIWGWVGVIYRGDELLTQNCWNCSNMSSQTSHLHSYNQLATPLSPGRCMPDQLRCVILITDLISYLLLLFHLYFSSCLLGVRWGEGCLGIGGCIYVYLHGEARGECQLPFSIAFSPLLCETRSLTEPRRHWFGLSGHPSSPKDSAVSASPAGNRRVDYGSGFCFCFCFTQVLWSNVGPHVSMTITLLSGSSRQLPLTLFSPHIEFCCLWKLAKLEHQSQNFRLKSGWSHPYLSIRLASDSHCNDGLPQPPVLPSPPVLFQHDTDSNFKLFYHPGTMSCFPLTVFLVSFTLNQSTCF